MQERKIDSPERMIEVIREYGIIPFFRCGVPGWSIEEMTAPGCWFTDEENGGTLGPWDWKIEAVREGDIAYGKFLGGKAAFATVEWYRELMNWRRSIPKYRMALGEKYKASTNSEKLMRFLSPLALSAIKDAGALEARELRVICSKAVTPAFVRSMGAKYKPLLASGVKKGIMDSVVQFLQMGTWTVIGDIQRVYSGPDLHYSGWQRASNTTPDELFGGMLGSGWEADGVAGAGADRVSVAAAGVPAWARRFEEATGAPEAVSRTPEESRARLISHIREFFPAADEKTLLKLI
jgi:hypothetical protein